MTKVLGVGITASHVFGPLVNGDLFINATIVFRCDMHLFCPLCYALLHHVETAALHYAPLDTDKLSICLVLDGFAVFEVEPRAHHQAAKDVVGDQIA